jgi:hypothetical protein
VTGCSGENPVRDEYSAALVRAAGDQAVAQAEAVVAEVWLTELESLRNASRRGLATALTAYRMAEATLREARQHADTEAVAQARRHMAQGRTAVRRSAEVADLMARLISRELDALTVARREHARTARENLARLRAARRNAPGSG